MIIARFMLNLPAGGLDLELLIITPLLCIQGRPQRVLIIFFVVIREREMELFTMK